ncbi:MAG: XRE family transcriptional regulator [Microbacteriaceae bacterium]|nr:MAG: XRE family transcriptional regulator [Microbacteriaceae bacterium]
MDAPDDVMTPGAQFGVALRSVREHLGLSQAEAAAEAGWNAFAWARLERGVVANPTLGTLLTAAAAVDVPLSDLVAGLQVGTGTGQPRKYTASQLREDHRKRAQ